jgi:hypothetical protein
MNTNILSKPIVYLPMLALLGIMMMQALMSLPPVSFASVNPDGDTEPNRAIQRGGQAALQPPTPSGDTADGIQRSLQELRPEEYAQYEKNFQALWDQTEAKFASNYPELGKTTPVVDAEKVRALEADLYQHNMTLAEFQARLNAIYNPGGATLRGDFFSDLALRQLFLDDNAAWNYLMSIVP